MNRRRFLKQTGAAAGLTAMQELTGAAQGVSIIIDRRDAIASAPPAKWAVGELQSALNEQGIASKVYARLGDAPAGDRYLMAAGKENAAAREILRRANVELLRHLKLCAWCKAR